MSKELIERLISYIPNGDGHNSQYANDLADAVVLLEVKAAPVGEREAFDQWYREKKGLRESTDTTFINEAFFPYKAFQAGAAYQRQSGVVMPERKPIEALEFNRTTIDVLNEGWNACLDEFARLNGGSHE